MFLNKLKVVAAALLPFVIGGGFWASRAASGTDAKAADEPVRSISKPATPVEKGPHGKFQMVGTVRVEGTGEPVAGATVKVMIGDSGKDHRGAYRTAQSGEDGRYTVDLPPGHARAWTLIRARRLLGPRTTPEASRSSSSPETSRSTARTTSSAVAPSGISGSPAPTERSRSRASSRPSDQATFLPTAFVDDTGRVRLTLPTEEGKVTVSGGENAERPESVQVTWSGSRDSAPTRVASVTNLGGSPVRYRLTDDNGKTATISATRRAGRSPGSRAESSSSRSHCRSRTRRRFGDLAGKVVDTSGKPIARGLGGVDMG